MGNLRRKLNFIAIGVYFFTNGVEYAVILPTMWLYISSRFHAEEWFLGIMLSAFSFSGLFASPIMGRLSDKISNTKWLLIFAILWEICGNFMYFMGISKWFLLGSRLVAGVSNGGDSVLLAEISRGTSEEARTRILSVVIAIRQFGLVIGPAFNLFLRLCDFSIGPYTVDEYTSPGLFMCCCWCVVGVMFLFMYTGLSSTHPEVSNQVITDNTVRDGYDITDNTVRDAYDPILTEAADEQTKQITSYGTVNEKRSDIDQSHSQMDDNKETKANVNQKLTLQFLANEFLREEVVALLAVQFISVFNQLVLETMVTPLTQKYMNWGELENSILFCVAGAEVILVFVIVGLISKRVSDRVLVLVGLLMMCAATSWMAYFLPVAVPGDAAANLPGFISAIVVDVGSLPLLMTCAMSLYTKVTRKETQGLCQGVRRSVVSLALILGPLWAGAAITRLYIMFGVMLFLLAISLIMMLLSMKRMIPIKDRPVRRSSQDRPVRIRRSSQSSESQSERQPLIS